MNTKLKNSEHVRTVQDAAGCLQREGCISGAFQKREGVAS